MYKALQKIISPLLICPNYAFFIKWLRKQILKQYWLKNYYVADGWTLNLVKWAFRYLRDVFRTLPSIYDGLFC